MQDHRHTHLAIKERQIASKYLAIHDCQIASMSYQTKYSKREYWVPAKIPLNWFRPDLGLNKLSLNLV
jgi:hypothetical protein